MIIYEVNHDVQKEIEKEYSEWLGSHVEEMLRFKGFAKVDWYTLITEGSEAMVHWCIHYHVESMSDLQDYMERHAPRMRAEGASRFGSNYSTSRRILHPRQHFE